VPVEPMNTGFAGISKKHGEKMNLGKLLPKNFAMSPTVTNFVALSRAG